MKIIDISREIFTAPIYENDPQPSFRWFKSMNSGADYNLSVIGATTHTGTHLDAPRHFIRGGQSIDKCELEKCYGSCTVVTVEGILTGQDMDKLLPYCKKRLLIHGNGKASLSLSAARVITENKLLLIGIDSVSISFDEAEEADVHRELLSNGTLILENVCLDKVRDGDYILSALPLKLGGLEASPVRAVLVTK